MKICVSCGAVAYDLTSVCENCGGNEFSPLFPVDSNKKSFSQMASAFLKALIYVAFFNAAAFIWSYVYMFGIILLSDVLPNVTDRDGNLTLIYADLANIFIYIMFAVSLVVFFKARHKNVLRELTLKKIPLRDALICGVFGYTANLVYTVAMSFIPWPKSLIEQHNTAYGDIGGEGSNIFLTILATAIFTGIIEELVFRGLVVSRLKRAFGTVPCVVISSLFFGFAHPTVFAIIYSTILGLILALIYLKYDSVLPCIAVHVFFNLAPCIGYPEGGLTFFALLLVCLIAHGFTFAYIFNKNNIKEKV